MGCRPECVLSTDCPRDKACVRQKCVDPCPGTCGTNARCEVVNHIPMCSCPERYSGNPFVDCRPYQGKAGSMTSKSVGGCSRSDSLTGRVALSDDGGGYLLQPSSADSSPEVMSPRGPAKGRGSGRMLRVCEGCRILPLPIEEIAGSGRTNSSSLARADCCSRGVALVLYDRPKCDRIEGGKKPGNDGDALERRVARAESRTTSRFPGRGSFRGDLCRWGYGSLSGTPSAMITVRCEEGESVPECFSW